MDGSRREALAALAFTTVGTALATGCAAPLAIIGTVAGFNMRPAAYGNLAHSRVAVVCVASSASTRGTIDSLRLAEGVENALRARVSGIKLVPQAEIDDWKDTNDWDHVDYRQIGRGVKAEKVLAIDIKTYSLHGSQTLLQGTAEIEITVFDMTDGGRVAFRKSPPVYRFPRHAGNTVTDTSESDFRRMFVAYLAAEIAREFHAYDPDETMVSDLSFVQH